MLKALVIPCTIQLPALLMRLSGILPLMADALSFLWHLARVGGPPDQLTPCSDVEVAHSPLTFC